MIILCICMCNISSMHCRNGRWYYIYCVHTTLSIHPLSGSVQDSLKSVYLWCAIHHVSYSPDLGVLFVCWVLPHSLVTWLPEIWITLLDQKWSCSIQHVWAFVTLYVKKLPANFRKSDCKIERKIRRHYFDGLMVLNNKAWSGDTAYYQY